VKLAPVDLSKLGAMLKKADEGPDADDPRELRARIAELEEQLAGGTAEPDPAAIEEAEKRGYDLAMRGVATATERLVTLGAAITEQITAFQEDLQRLGAADVTCRSIDIQKLSETHESMGSTPSRRASRDYPRATQVAHQSGLIHTKPSRAAAKDAGGNLPKGERMVLTAIAQHRAGVTPEQLTVLLGYKRSSRNTYLQRLRERGLIEQAGNTITATRAGSDALGPDFEHLPTGDALRKYWMERLPAGERRVLEVVCQRYPLAVDREVISERTGYERSSRNTYIQRLAARQLVVPAPSGVRASETLFEK
jgi:hypothetical protein